MDIKVCWSRNIVEYSALAK